MQTKVRIVGDSALSKKIAKVIEEHFEIKKREKFGTVPYRYATKMPLGCSIYITIKKEKTEPVDPDELQHLDELDVKRTKAWRKAMEKPNP